MRLVRAQSPPAINAPRWRTEVDDLRKVLPHPEVRRLGNGLTLCLVKNRRVPVVATAVMYRTGTRDDAPGHGGTAHFLEHMMFKGSARYGPGEIDHLTRALGGSNNAFTSHDSTVYHFTFAADRWHRALDVEADRMAGLTLDPTEVDAERQVILEEIAMYEGEPWETLERRVTAETFAPHPYGRPVLGTRAELEATDAGVLGDFHRRYYQPAGAVLVIAGDVADSAAEEAERAFGDLPGRPFARAEHPPRTDVDGLRRIEVRRGEIARMLLALPAPPASHPDHPRLQLLTQILGTGRSSRLHRALVDEGQMCLWISADFQETLDPGVMAVALEVVPGVEPRRVEDEVLREIDRLREQGPTAEEISRAQRMTLADWVFGHEKVFQQAFLAGSSLALYDLEHPWRYFERLLAAERDHLADVAKQYLRPRERGVLGWSLPRAGGNDAG